MEGIVSPLRFELKLNAMKLLVIKEYAGIKEGSEVNISESNINYMIKKGYVRPIEEIESITPIQAKVVTEYETKVIVPQLNVTIEGSKLAVVLDTLDKKKRGRKGK